MHFSIPDSQELKENGNNYTGFNIHVNGIFHCTVRYRQLYSLYEQIKKEFSLISSQLPAFPSKKILPLSSSQLEDRRQQLEKYIQAVGQEPVLSSSELFNGFLSAAQQETSGLNVENSKLDIFLMNGYKITLDVQTCDRSDHILQKVCEKINLPEEYTYYFALFLIKSDEDGDIVIIRRLQDFESPFISQHSIKYPTKIVIRKSYWDSEYDLELMTNKVSLNLLYVQTVSDVEHGWVLCSEEIRSTLANFQSRGAKREYLELARTLKYYGFLQFRPCVCDYPSPGSKVLVSAGNKELNLRVRLTEGDDLRQGSFKVTRMRCWRITTLHSNDPKNPESSDLKLSFEYLMAKDKLQWITISSEQAILMSICLQSMVDELLLKKSAVRRKTAMTGKQNIWNYVKRDGSSQVRPINQSSSASELSSLNQNTKKAPSSNAGQGELLNEGLSNSRSMKKLSGKLQNVGFGSGKSLVKNECFDNDGIGDDDLMERENEKGGGQRTSATDNLQLWMHREREPFLLAGELGSCSSPNNYCEPRSWPRSDPPPSPPPQTNIIPRAFVKLSSSKTISGQIKCRACGNKLSHHICTLRGKGFSKEQRFRTRETRTENPVPTHSFVTRLEPRPSDCKIENFFFPIFQFQKS